MKLSPVLLGIVALVVILALWLGGAYNRLVQLNAQVDTQWAQVETQYQRRFDLIPNLVEATKGVLVQEQEVFGTIAQARQNYAGTTTPDERAEAATQLESGLARLLVIVENYPQLQSNQTVRALMDELAGTENRISVERRRYNETVQSYNVTIRSIPTSLIAGPMGFESRQPFQAASGAETAPRVDLNTQ